MEMYCNNISKWKIYKLYSYERNEIIIIYKRKKNKTVCKKNWCENKTEESVLINSP